MPRGVPKVKATLQPPSPSQAAPSQAVVEQQPQSKAAPAAFVVPQAQPIPQVQPVAVAQPVLPIKCNNCASHGLTGNAFIDPKTNRYNCFTCGSNGVAIIETVSSPVVAHTAQGYVCPKCMSARVAPTSPTGNYACGNPVCQHTWIQGAEAASLVSSRPAQLDTTDLAMTRGSLSPSQTVSTALGQGGGALKK